MSTLDIHLSEPESPIVLVLTGSVDGLTADAFAQAFQAQIEAGHSEMVADFSQVSYTSSAGLRSLLIVLKEARRMGGDLRLAALRTSVSKVLSISGLDSIVRIFATTEEARASFNKVKS